MYYWFHEFKVASCLTCDVTCRDIVGMIPIGNSGTYFSYGAAADTCGAMVEAQQIRRQSKSYFKIVVYVANETTGQISDVSKVHVLRL